MVDRSRQQKTEGHHQRPPDVDEVDQLPVEQRSEHQSAQENGSSVDHFELFEMVAKVQLELNGRHFVQVHSEDQEGKEHQYEFLPGSFFYCLFVFSFIDSSKYLL